MCRIAGIIDRTRTFPLNDTLKKMTDAMHRGGPDDEGFYIVPEKGIGLGHRRLSLLDLSSAGHQPMCDDSGRYQIVFNGEIYNFPELKRLLIAEGYHFRTQTDTEVILYAYRHWGIDCFSRFNGMFALAIYDEDANTLTLARDHAGMKPLYVYESKDQLVFASEIRSFKKIGLRLTSQPGWEGIFLVYGHLPEPYTTIKEILPLAKGTAVQYTLSDFEKYTKIFYAPTTAQLLNTCTEEDAVQLIRDRLSAAVERHLVSDAPIGLFLSGGIDSSILTLLAAPVLKNNLHTLSIQFEEEAFSEKIYQDIIINATNANHVRFVVGKKDFEDNYNDIMEAMDQPTIDGINTYFISMLTKQFGLKAVLSGIGADELFGGYPSFNRYAKWKQLRKLKGILPKLIPGGIHPSFSKLKFLNWPELLSLYLMNRGLFTVEKAAAITGFDKKALADLCYQIRLAASPQHNLNDVSLVETGLYMQNQLLKDADYMGMWHSIEIRLPFLDKELMDAINSICPELKYGADLKKRLLLKAFFTLLPAEIWARKKQGFTFPFDLWLKDIKSFEPANAAEESVFHAYQQGKLHWSRYWALKIVHQQSFCI